MKKVGAFEAKTKLSELLRDVEERHEEIVITRHHRNIARLVPFDDSREQDLSKGDILKGFRKIRKKQTPLNSDELRNMIDEGRMR